MNDIEQVLQTEYSEEFDKLRKNRMFVSYHKYGPIKNNYGEGLINSIENLEIRLKKYKETGNTEFLVDVANFAMIEFMYPKHGNAHFDSETHGTRLKGMTVNDLKQL
jgi:hypothetical protein